MKHAQALAEYSIMANMESGLPINVWAARKIIETEPIFTAFGGQMPITREFRFFFNNHKLVCFHPYWPATAINGHTEDKNWKEKLDTINKLTAKEEKLLTGLTRAVSYKFEGFWSVDWLQGKDKNWYAIDMATGEDSYHYPSCKKGAKLCQKEEAISPKGKKENPKKTKND
jgi:hypothetical protein